jgi:hypothetical protein
MRCEIDSTAPGPCVLQSPTVLQSPEWKDWNFWCIKFNASSDIVVFQLAVTSGVSILNTRNGTRRSLNAYDGSICIPLPTAENAVYGVQLSAMSYLSSSAEWAEVLYTYIWATDRKTFGELLLFDFVYNFLYSLNANASIDTSMTGASDQGLVT